PPPLFFKQNEAKLDWCVVVVGWFMFIRDRFKDKKISFMNPELRKLLEKEMVNFLFLVKDVHIEGYTPPEK
ncbi:hypothetical protein ACVGWJ_01150, partial [Enterobacter hormaechei]